VIFLSKCTAPPNVSLGWVTGWEGIKKGLREARGGNRREGWKV